MVTAQSALRWNDSCQITLRYFVNKCWQSRRKQLEWQILNWVWIFGVLIECSSRLRIDCRLNYGILKLCSTPFSMRYISDFIDENSILMWEISQDKYIVTRLNDGPLNICMVCSWWEKQNRTTTKMDRRRKIMVTFGLTRQSGSWRNQSLVAASTVIYTSRFNVDQLKINQLNYTFADHIALFPFPWYHWTSNNKQHPDRIHISNVSHCASGWRKSVRKWRKTIKD